MAKPRVLPGTWWKGDFDVDATAEAFATGDPAASAAASAEFAARGLEVRVAEDGVVEVRRVLDPNRPPPESAQL